MENFTDSENTNPIGYNESIVITITKKGNPIPYLHSEREIIDDDTPPLVECNLIRESTYGDKTESLHSENSLDLIKIPIDMWPPDNFGILHGEDDEFSYFDATRSALKELYEETMGKVFGGRLVPLSKKAISSCYNESVEALCTVIAKIIQHIAGIYEEPVFDHLVDKLSIEKQSKLEDEDLADIATVVQLHIAGTFSTGKLIFLLQTTSEILHKKSALDAAEIAKSAAQAVKYWRQQDLYRLQYNPPNILFELAQANTLENTLRAINELKGDFEGENLRHIVLSAKDCGAVCSTMQSLVLDLERLLRFVTGYSDSILPPEARERLYATGKTNSSK